MKSDQEVTQRWMLSVISSQRAVPSEAAEDGAQPPGEFSEIPPYLSCL